MTRSLQTSNIVDMAHSIKFVNDHVKEIDGMYWDITYRCNLKCSHCLYSCGDNRCNDYSQELTSEQVDNVIRQIVTLRPRSFCICGGEPMLRYDVVTRILAELKNVGVNVNMVTNGLLLTDDNCIEMKKLGINSIQVSLDGLGWQHDRFRNKIGAFEQTVEAIEKLRKHSIPANLSFCPNKYNYYSFPDYVKFAHGLKCTHIRMMPLTPLGRGKINYEELKLTEVEMFDFVQSVHCMKSLYPGIQIDWGDPLEYIRQVLINRRTKPVVVGILANGDLTVTPYVDIVVGNVLDKSLVDSWEHGINRAYTNAAIIETFKSLRTLDDLFFRDNCKKYIDLWRD